MRVQGGSSPKAPARSEGTSSVCLGASPRGQREGSAPWGRAASRCPPGRGGGGGGQQTGGKGAAGGSSVQGAAGGSSGPGAWGTGCMKQQDTGRRGEPSELPPSSLWRGAQRVPRLRLATQGQRRGRWHPPRLCAGSSHPRPQRRTPRPPLSEARSPEITSGGGLAT